MNDNDIRILTIDTAARCANLALMVCPQDLSVKRANILDHLVKSEKFDQSIDPDSRLCGFDSILAGLFKHCRYSHGREGRHPSLPSSSSQTLIPEIGELLAEHGLQPDDVDLLVVALGPGSFTGLRIGVVAAKTFAYSTAGNLVGVDLMEAVAHQADWVYRHHSGPDIAVATNAGRGDLLAASYHRTPSGELQQSQPARIYKPEEWVHSLPDNAIVTGEGIELLDEAQLQSSGFEVVDKAARSAAIETLALIGLQRFFTSGSDNCWTLQPIYSRPSAAEEAAAKSQTSK